MQYDRVCPTPRKFKVFRSLKKRLSHPAAQCSIIMFCGVIPGRTFVQGEYNYAEERLLWHTRRFRGGSMRRK